VQCFRQYTPPNIGGGGSTERAINGQAYTYATPLDPYFI